MNDQDQAKWDAELRQVVKGLHAMAAVTNPQASAFLCRAANLIEQMRTTFTHKANLLPLREACEAALRFIKSPLNTSEEIVAMNKQLEDALRSSQESQGIYEITKLKKENEKLRKQLSALLYFAPHGG